MAMIMEGAPLHYPTTHPVTPALALVGVEPVLLIPVIPVRTSRTASIARLAVAQHGPQVCKEKRNIVSISWNCFCSCVQ